MQYHRLAMGGGQFKLGGEKHLLALPQGRFTQRIHEIVQADLAHGDNFPVRLQQLLQPQQVVVAVLGNVAGMQARRRQQARRGDAGTDTEKLAPQGCQVPGDDDRIDAGSHGPRRHGIAVAVEFLDIEMAMGIDQRRHVHACTVARRRRRFNARGSG
jgi:hypothetical protein